MQSVILHKNCGQYSNTAICTEKICATANDTRPANLVASDLRTAIWYTILFFHHITWSAHEEEPQQLIYLLRDLIFQSVWCITLWIFDFYVVFAFEEWIRPIINSSPSPVSGSPKIKMMNWGQARNIRLLRTLKHRITSRWTKFARTFSQTKEIHKQHSWW